MGRSLESRLHAKKNKILYFIQLFMQNWQAKGRVNRSTIILSVYGQTGPEGYLDRGIVRLPLDLPILFFARRWESNSQSIQYRLLMLISKGGILLRLIWADGIRVRDKNWTLLWSCNRLFFFSKNGVDMGNKYDTVIDIETFILNKI